MSVRKSDNAELYAKVEEQNLLRQYDLLLNCIEIGLIKGIEAFDKYTLWSLNAAATANIAQFGGRYREEPIYVGNHRWPWRSSSNRSNTSTLSFAAFGSGTLFGGGTPDAGFRIRSPRCSRIGTI